MTGGPSATLDVRSEDGRLVLGLAGELDLTCVGRIRTAIDAALAGQSEQVVFDLSELSFMDSSGIALLLSVAQQAGGVSLRDPTPIIRRLIELTGLSSVLPMSP